MVVYRLQKAKHGKDISGRGTLYTDGRWHLSGSLPMLYTSSSKSLAILETIAHLPINVVPPKMMMLEIFVPDKFIVEPKQNDLPIGWNEYGYLPSVQTWGMDWLLSQKELAIAVPSVISGDKNILINPLHLQFKKVKLITSTDFMIDGRLI